MPPQALFDLEQVLEEGGYPRFVPAPEVWGWITEHILDDEGGLANPDHAHLQEADVAVLWASGSFAKQGRVVIGQAEQVMFRAGGWQKGRAERQMVDWFGAVPSFVITLAADYCAQCTDAEFCALVEHELYHIAQAKDQYGAPKFRKDTGLPTLELRGHDVEEFVGVVRRYGASGAVQQLIDAAASPPEVEVASVAQACGTCLHTV